MPTDALTITWGEEPACLAIVGEIDVDTREQFQRALTQTSGRTGDTQLNLAGVSFMDTHSVTLVVRCANRLHEEGGRLVVHEAPDSLLRIFELLWAGDGDSSLHISGLRGEP